MTATAATDFIVATGYSVWLLVTGVATVFNAERYQGNKIWQEECGFGL